MALGGRLHRWWERLRGRDEPVVARPARRPAAARPLGQVTPTSPGGELRLTVEDEPGAAAGGRSLREAGFDPYASDGGHAKPRAWDRVDRK
jgi:hypothetical protein